MRACVRVACLPSGPRDLHTVAARAGARAVGECDRSPTDHDGWIGLTRSTSGGATWEAPRTLYGCGSPAALYSRSTDTVFVLFGECGAPTPQGPPYGLSAMSCAGGTVHWVLRRAWHDLVGMGG